MSRAAPRCDGTKMRKLYVVNVNYDCSFKYYLGTTVRAYSIPQDAVIAPRLDIYSIGAENEEKLETSAEPSEIHTGV